MIGKGSSYTSDFHDITSGNNNNGKGKSYNGVTGYDMVNRMGSPNGVNLINALAGASTPSFTLSDPSNLPLLKAVPRMNTITVNDQNGFTAA